MAILGAYFDESGNEADTPTVVVAGLIASKQQWDKFNRKWDRALQAEEIKFLHMSDLAHSWGQFKGWTEERKRPFLDRLFGIIESHARHYLVSVLKIDEFEKIRTEFGDIKLSAYQFCCVQCMNGIAKYMLDSDKRKKIDVVFELGNKFMSEGMRLFSEPDAPEQVRQIYKIAHIGTGSKEGDKPLQAADWLAYETFSDYKKFLNNSLRPTRIPFERFLKTKKVFHYRNDTPDSIRKSFEKLLSNLRIATFLRSSFLKPCP